MTNLCQATFILTVAITITITSGKSWEDREDNRFRLPSTIPSNLRIGEEVYDNALAQLADQLSVENVDITADGYFPKGEIMYIEKWTMSMMM